MAATAYAALVSLMTTINMEQTPSPLHPPFPFPAQLIEALLERVRFMVDFLEQGWKGAEHLEARITHLAYGAEDDIEIPIDDQIRIRPSLRRYMERGWKDSALSSQQQERSVLFRRDLERIIQDFDSIKTEMMLLIKDQGSGIIEDLHPGGSSSSTSSSTGPPQWEKTKMVGLEEEKSQIIDELTWQKPSLRIIPIVGMGGVGKTTLARNVYDDHLIMKHFDVRAWVTVSQQWDVKDVLLRVLSSLQKEGNAQMSVESLGEKVHKSLFDRRYLVIFDDVWSIEVWDEIKWCFPDNTNGSRIMVTTRLSNLAEELSTFKLGMKCLDEKNSWILFCEKVFGQRSCPQELQEVGNEIVRNCRGLPLAILVIGGLLAKSPITLEYWKHVAEYFSSYLYSTDGDHCSKMLLLSYNRLPVHLKPCFLYLGVFREDHNICASQLMRLWIAEGFLKALGEKTLEEIAEENLKDLIERNLIMVSSWGSSGKIKYCIIHDLLRELCLREAQKEMFFSVVKGKLLDAPLSLGYQRRIVVMVSRTETEKYPHIIRSVKSASHVRSLILPNADELAWVLVSDFFWLLRILFTADYSFFRTHLDYDYILPIHHDFMATKLNMRYVAFPWGDTFPSWIHHFRNFLVLEEGRDAKYSDAPDEVWDLIQLHAVQFQSFVLPEPPYFHEGQHDCVVLENLQSLSELVDCRFSEETIKRIPNIKKLKVHYRNVARKEWSHFSVHNLEYLKKLESFSFSFGFTPNRKEFLQNLAFPPSLKKLSLKGCKLLWEDMTMFGSLPHLEVLKLRAGSFAGTEWNPVEGEFCRLKFLYMESIEDLTNWNADGTHFPRLKRLTLIECRKLKEIPLDIGEISTLQLIKMKYCSFSAIMSAINILKEQQSLGNDCLLVEAYFMKKCRSLDGFEIKNFVAQSMLEEYAESENEEESQ